MTLVPRLDLRQSQSLVMTPQLQQAIKLLQMSNQDLMAFVAEEMERNPLLESAAPQDESAPPSPSEGFDEPSSPPLSETPEPISGNSLQSDTSRDGGESLSDRTEDWGRDDGSTRLSTHTPSDDDYDPLQHVANRPSLRDHLLEQIQLDFHDPADRMVAIALMELLDESGYLPRDLEVVRAQLGLESERFQHIIERLQNFDPIGIFARSLQECLAAQLREKNRLDPAMDILLKHLDLVGKKDRAGLMRICGVDANDLSDMLDELRALNPKPALAFASDVVIPVIPDVLLRMTPGGWHVELNSDTLPRVLANERYYTTIQASARRKEDKDYLSDRWQQANWLVKSLHQRATTILKVATEIVKQQDRFFTDGVQYLKPLILRDIATAIDMHESTISRVTQNKYIATPRGLFELKYFFTTALARNDCSESISSETVRQRIKSLIDAEMPKAILSDDKIAALLHDEGIDIARRTIAKYREAMGIGSSAERRRDKRS